MNNQKIRTTIIPLSIILGAILGYLAYKKVGTVGATLTVIGTLGLGALVYTLWDTTPDMVYTPRPNTTEPA